MPSKDPDTGKRISGAATRKRGKQAAEALGGAQGAPAGSAKPDKAVPLTGEFAVDAPPSDALGLQVWGCALLAKLAWQAASRPDLVVKSQHDLIRNHLSSMGLLFPRAELVRRLQKATASRKDKGAKDELKPLHGIDPGPTSRTRG